MIIVTGGAGFIGSNIVASLNEHQKTDIVICDTLGTDEKWRNIAKREFIDLIRPDRLFEFLEKHQKEVGTIVHMGAISATTERDADLIVENNLRLSLDLWEWCAKHQKRLIYASSAATYGDGRQGFEDDEDLETQSRLRPMNAYGWSKLAFDRRILRAVKEGEHTPPQWAGLKFFNVYGPNEYHKGTMKSVIAHLFPNAADGQPVSLFRSHNPLYPDGGQMRDFVYVKDCADIVLWLIANMQVSGLFNVGTGEARTFKDLAKASFTALNRVPEITYRDTPEDIRDRYQYFTQATMNRLRDAGYDRPFTSLEDGVADYIRNYLLADDPYR